MMGHFKTTLLFTAALLIAGPASAQIGGDLPDPNASETVPASSDTSLPERPVSIQTPSNTSTQQTDRSEERWRRSRKKPGNSDIFEGNPASTGVGGGLGGLNNPYEADPIDQLPAESRRHLLRQRAAMIAGAGEEYKPSDAAETDPALQEQEKEIWEAMVEDMKQRERAAQSGQQQGGQGQQGQEGQQSEQGQQGERQSGSRSEQRQAQQQQSQGGSGQSQSQQQGQQQQGRQQPNQGGGGGGQGDPSDSSGQSGGAGPVGPRGGSSTSVAEILNGIKGGRARSGSPDGIPGGTGRGQGQAPSGQSSGRGQGQNPFGGLPPIGGQPGGGAQPTQVSLPGTGGAGTQPRTGPLGDNPFGGVPGVSLPTPRIGQPGAGQPNSGQDRGSESERGSSQTPSLPSVRIPGALGDPANGSAPSPGQGETRTPPVVTTAGRSDSGQGGATSGEGNGQGTGSGNAQGGLAGGDQERGFGGIAGPGQSTGQSDGASQGANDGESTEASTTPTIPSLPPTTPAADASIGPLERARQSRTEGPARGTSSASGYIRRDR